MTWFHGIFWFFRLKIDKIPYLIKTLTGLGLVEFISRIFKAIYLRPNTLYKLSNEA